MSPVSLFKLSAQERYSFNVTDLRTETREFLDNVHLSGWHYMVQRAGQPMIGLLDHDQYKRLLALTASCGGKVVARQGPAGRTRSNAESRRQSGVLG